MHSPRILQIFPAAEQQHFTICAFPVCDLSGQENRNPQVERPLILAYILLNRGYYDRLCRHSFRSQYITREFSLSPFLSSAARSSSSVAYRGMNPFFP